MRGEKREGKRGEGEIKGMEKKMEEEMKKAGLL